VASIVPRNPDSLVSGFGDPVTVELTPRVQIDAVYWVVSTDHQTLLLAGGSGSVTDDARGRRDYHKLRIRGLSQHLCC